MAKVALDMDMPESCSKCKFLYEFQGIKKCQLMNALNNGASRLSQNTFTEKRHEKCPLRELPQQETLSATRIRRMEQGDDMKDRYLYKAKRVDNGQWVQGNLVYSEDSEDGWETLIIPTRESNMFTKGGSKGNLGFENWYRVDQDTICQCTGLKDTNGTLIWENDIIKDLFSDVCAQIKYGSYQSCFDSTKTEHVGFYVDWSGKYTKRYRKDLGYWINMVDAEIAGNAFDNVELLESEGEYDRE